MASNFASPHGPKWLLDHRGYILGNKWEEGGKKRKVKTAAISAVFRSSPRARPSDLPYILPAALGYQGSRKM